MFSFTQNCIISHKERVGCNSLNSWHCTVGWLIGGGGGGRKYLHSTEPWAGNLTTPVTWRGCHQPTSIVLTAVLITPCSRPACSSLQFSSLSSLSRCSALLSVAARPRLSTVRPEYYGPPGPDWPGRHVERRERREYYTIHYTALQVPADCRLQQLGNILTLPSCSSNTPHLQSSKK